MMGLSFPVEWRFNPPSDGAFITSEIPEKSVDEFFVVIERVAGQTQRWSVLEHFKKYFGDPHKSSSESWAEGDLVSAMMEKAKVAPLFIESFFAACEGLIEQGLKAPDVPFINNLLLKQKIGYEISEDELRLRGGGAASVVVPVESVSIDASNKKLILNSLTRSERLLDEGRAREAVQEILWLLETVATAFNGLETGSGKVEGKYFNLIVKDLQRKKAGTTLENVLRWVVTMHGFLSSPTGGGVRHGVDLKAGVALSTHEARLFCNLTRSYILFLLDEYEASSLF